MHSIAEWFVVRMRETPSAVAYSWRDENGWHERTWLDTALDVCWLTERLIDLGIGHGDRVGQLSENRYAWVVADLAIQFATAVHVPLHPHLTADQLRELVDHCQPRLLLTTGDHFARLVGAESRASRTAASTSADRRSLPPVWLIDSVSSSVEGGTHLALLSSGDQTEFASASSCEAVAGRLARWASHVDPDLLMTILYTSGTTGQSKGVMLSHRNVVSNVAGKLQMLSLGTDDVRLGLLPLTHIFARSCDLYTGIAAGSCHVFSRGREAWLAELAEVRPTYINAVPYFYEKLHRTLAERGELDEPGAMARLLGGRVRVCNCGGAPLDLAVFDYYRSVGVPLVTGYGLTETSPVVSSSRLDDVRRGSVGRALPGVEIRLAADGEVLVRGPNVMLGYYRDDEATASAIRDGWLYTGDVGHLDDAGHLFITGRKKELIVTSGGQNIPPLVIEGLLNADPLIAQSCVFGDRQDFLVAVIVPDKAAAESTVGGSRSNPRGLRRALRQAIERRLRGRSRFEQIGEFVIADEEFSVANGQLTVKNSLRREQIFARYQAEIAAAYRRRGRRNQRA
jgi:long-chain acyl-CoA synthetase